MNSTESNRVILEENISNIPLTSIEPTIKVKIWDEYSRRYPSIERSMLEEFYSDEECLVMTKVFAKKNLSQSALKYAAAQTEQEYYWTRCSFYLVLYELPIIHKPHFQEILTELSNYCKGYAEENNLHDGNIFSTYVSNQEKVLII